MPTEPEILAARLTRIKYLIDALEAACSKSLESRDTFLKLKQEIDAARAAVRATGT